MTIGIMDGCAVWNHIRQGGYPEFQYTFYSTPEGLKAYLNIVQMEIDSKKITKKAPLKQKFKLLDAKDTYAKELQIATPDDNLCIFVDYDDVDHKSAWRLTKKMIKILNEHWND